MKVLKIVLAILIPVGVVAAILPLVYPLVSPLSGVEFDIGKIFENLGELFKDFSAAIKLYGLAIVIMLVAPVVGSLLLVLWIVFGIAKKRLIGILFGFIAAFALTFGALGVLVDAVFNAAAILAEVDNAGYAIMQYVEIGAIVLFIAAFVIHVIIMFKVAKARKAAKKAAEAKAKEEFEVNYDDLPPVLFEKQSKHIECEPAVIRHKVDHIQPGENHILKGHYVRDDEIDVILAASSYRYEDEIPEEILAWLDAKHEAEERGETLPMFDPNFVPSHEEEAIYTDDELRIIEALSNSQPKAEAEEEPVPESVLAFLNSKPQEEAELSEEELEVVRAMSQYNGPSSKEEDVEYVDLPFFREHEEPVEYVEEIIRVPEEKVEEDVEAPKVSSDKPVHISKNNEGKYQLKQVGEKKPFAVYDSEEEAIKYGQAVKRVYGVAVRLHDSEGKISSL